VVWIGLMPLAVVMALAQDDRTASVLAILSASERWTHAQDLLALLLLQAAPLCLLVLLLLLAAPLCLLVLLPLQVAPL